MKTEGYDQFPLPLVFLCVSATVSIYAIGAYLIAPMGIISVALYLLFCLGMEIRVLITGCRDCYYFGKLCAFGRGKICSLLFEKGIPERFIEKKISWKSLVPDFLVSIVPIFTGGLYLFTNFSWERLVMILAFGVIAFPLTGFIRGSISCRYCKQKEFGCPAIQFFSKNNPNTCCAQPGAQTDPKK